MIRRPKYVPDFIARRLRKSAVDAGIPESVLRPKENLVVPVVDLPPPPPPQPRTKVRIRTDPAFLAGVFHRLRENQNTERVSVSRVVVDAAILELQRLAAIDARTGT